MDRRAKRREARAQRKLPYWQSWSTKASPTPIADIRKVQALTGKSVMCFAQEHVHVLAVMAGQPYPLQ